jgi:hypothetical protein
MYSEFNRQRRGIENLFGNMWTWYPAEPEFHSFAMTVAIAKLQIERNFSGEDKSVGIKE